MDGKADREDALQLKLQPAKVKIRVCMLPEESMTLTARLNSCQSTDMRLSKQWPMATSFTDTPGVCDLRSLSK